MNTTALPEVPRRRRRIDSQVSKENISYQELLGIHLRQCRIKNLATVTIDGYRTASRYFLDFAGSGLMCGDIIRHFDRALNDDNNMTAKALYSTNADHEKFANKAQAVVEEYIQKNVNAYCGDGIQYKAAKQRISDLSWCQGIAETRTDALIKIGDIQTSKKSYEDAEIALKKAINRLSI